MTINNRSMIRILLVSSFIVLNVLLLFGLSNILNYLNTGADRSSMLHLERETVDTYLPALTWDELKNIGRKMEPTTLKKIEKDYLFSWYVKNKSLKSNDKQGIEDFYTQNARVNLYKSIDYNLRNHVSIESTSLKHHPKLEFYSEDGQQVVFTDKNVIEFQRIFKNEKLITEVQDTATYKIMMLLEDGFWRVRHIEKMSAIPVATDTVKKNPEFSVSGDKILFKNSEFTFKGINYYPKNSAWDTFGDAFNKDTIARDFDIIKSAKLNSIRIFIQYDDFGKANLKPEKIEKLRILLDLAHAKGLRVVVTLFDFYSDYTLESWTLTGRHAEKLVSEFKNHKAIAAWDIKNEPNLDFESRDRNNVLNWLKQMITVVQEHDPNHLVTIGWSNSTEAKNLEDKVDFVSFHYYHSIDDFEYEYNILQKATKKPLVVQEFGIPSYRGFWRWFGEDEEDQAEYHKKMQALFKKNNLAFMSWTLYDFPSVPNQVAGKWPWQKNRQKKFGFIDEKGIKKPSFLYITN